MTQNALDNRALYPHPFSKVYWKQAAGEFKKRRVLIFAALMIGLRVALKSLGIPIAADLKINIAFFINAYGAMVFGPVVAIVAAAISDTLGCILFPTGVYFFPFIFIEIAGSLCFALFLYRAEITAKRVILSRFCIDFFVNIVLNTPVMWLYYKMVMGKSYAIFDLVRIVKNLAMFPIESVLLILFLRMVIPPTQKLGYIYSGIDKLRFNRKNIILLVALVLIGAGAVTGYAIYSYNTTSLSASYSTQERLARNGEMNEWVVAEADGLDAGDTVTIIEAANRKVGDPDLVYTLAVYRLDAEKFAAQAAADETYTLETVRGYSKSKAAKDEALTRIGSATAVTDKKTGEHKSIEVHLD
ncbi:MAG: folate family ECF transporter S component [Clostridia bacterium]|nr:folate family ECF transporter S component [Clostridia bacterium]